ncbi:ATP-binding domain-containing protein [Neorhizobium sp. BETTINA12A]|uniref:ATP-binding domain-containing protein n=1 Tax=Neorhizobium sp. BETTINA12A TaxID=2908924 RepID=UPI001FF2C4DC|nr:ATP-binding domain-containing protein [Neorhizobium sp. BETTINA12A]MCJ9749892.1 ATP-binding domain-containing protein [Neorhizobium sp. BETTINA12A]
MPNRTLQLCGYKFGSHNLSYGTSRQFLRVLLFASVHKAQGSAFKRVIIPVVRSKLLDRTMLYTAITRDVETVVIAGDIDLINEMVAAAPASLERNTALRFDEN